MVRPLVFSPFFQYRDIRERNITDTSGADPTPRAGSDNVSGSSSGIDDAAYTDLLQRLNKLTADDDDEVPVYPPPAFGPVGSGRPIPAVPTRLSAPTSPPASSPVLPAATTALGTEAPSSSPNTESGDDYWFRPFSPSYSPSLPYYGPSRQPDRSQALGFPPPVRLPGEPFRPMAILSGPHSESLFGLATQAQAQSCSPLTGSGCSPRYQGNPHLVANQSVNIPDEDNCSFFITGLPADISYHTLLGQVRSCGRVYASYINRADFAKGHHTSAAKIVFFEKADARRFWVDKHACGQLPFLVKQEATEVAFAGRVVRNRVKVAEQNAATVPRNYTRVVRISGPKLYVNLEGLLHLFRQSFLFDVDEISEEELPGDSMSVAITFGSWRCQAACAFQVYNRAVERGQFRGCSIEYRRDPCDLLTEEEYTAVTHRCKTERTWQIYLKRCQAYEAASYATTTTGSINAQDDRHKEEKTSSPFLPAVQQMSNTCKG
ncbi:hypothetical protein B0H66DRAFT_226310 [Apodospora peruviana]|uniref:Uncharacterized protein n=1 Tax=Apodospora peruviana TaxID=516989 RepID=A0AAE0I3X1_9PEZI|nr:hypothetical protein B0H66DRAFT_226310 [Apodospora peruviana]